MSRIERVAAWAMAGLIVVWVGVGIALHMSLDDPRFHQSDTVQCDEPC